MNSPAPRSGTAEPNRKPPKGISRWFARAPIHLFHAKLGFLFRDRFMLLHHIGRKSGLPREVVIEVVKHDRVTGDYYACSGFGTKSQWYQNLMAHPDTTIQVRNTVIPVHATQLTPDEAVPVMADYARRHPKAARRLASFMGFGDDGDAETYREVARGMPFIRFSPT